LIGAIEHIGRYVKMLLGTFGRPEKLRMYWTELFRQMNDIGVGSLLIIGIISIFIGMVTAVQFSYQLQDSLIPQFYVGFIVRDSILIEFAPTISCLVLAGKVGSKIASELGSMRITEQIDALEIMGVNTLNYLVGPRILGAVLIIPFLVVIAAALGMFGGMLAANASGIPVETYERGLHSWFEVFNVNLMLVKAVVFAFILSSIACYQGFYVKGGALELGKASTRAVVQASILILAFDYVIAEILL